jgi:carbon-monoxide dehydrogenase small subunit
MKHHLEFTLNGHPVSAEISPSQSLLSLLREEFELTGAKEGCGEGECGACTVIVDGLAINACIFPAMEASGCRVETVEGLAIAGGGLHPLQDAFVEYGAVQCGFCSPGMIMSAKALLDSEASPDENQIRTAIEGNLCRCTGYKQIVDAIQAAAEKMR